MAVAHRDRHRRPGDGNCLPDSYAADTAAGHSCGRNQNSYLAHALIFHTERHLLSKAQTSWNYNPALLQEFCEQRTDATIGTIYLVLGFLGQLLSPPHKQVDDVFIRFSGPLFVTK